MHQFERVCGQSHVPTATLMHNRVRTTLERVPPRTPCASLSSVVGCVLDERCRCSVPCRHRRDVLHDAYLWRAGAVYSTTGAGAASTAGTSAVYSTTGAGAACTTVAGAMHSATGPGAAYAADAMLRGTFRWPVLGDQQTSSCTCVVLCLNNYNKFLSRELGR